MMFKHFSMGLALVLSASAMGAVGCTAHSDASEEESVGMLRLPLVTPTQSSYRLHTATFVIKSISGTTIATLDSDTDPDAQALTVDLSPSSYTVLLQDGWELDSVAADGTETPIQAALISVNPQSFNIKSATDTDLTFIFTTANGVVNIGNGTANVTVDVTSNVGLTACNVAGGYYNNCPSGQTCLLADATGRGFCGSAGKLPVGSLCSSEQCVVGSQCLKSDPSNPSQGICTKFCDTTATTFGCNCVSLASPTATLASAAHCRREAAICWRRRAAPPGKRASTRGVASVRAAPPGRRRRAARAPRRPASQAPPATTAFA